MHLASSYQSVRDGKTDEADDYDIAEDVDVMLHQIGLQVHPCSCYCVQGQRIEDHPKAQPEVHLKT